MFPYKLVRAETSRGMKLAGFFPTVLFSILLPWTIRAVIVTTAAREAFFSFWTTSDIRFRFLKCVPDSISFQKKVIEVLSELSCNFIEDLSVLANSNYDRYVDPFEELTNHLWMTSTDEYDLDLWFTIRVVVALFLARATTTEKLFQISFIKRLHKTSLF